MSTTVLVHVRVYFQRHPRRAGSRALPVPITRNPRQRKLKIKITMWPLPLRSNAQTQGPSSVENYLNKQLPPLPGERAPISSISDFRIAQLEWENNILRQQVRFYHSTYDAAKNLLQACNKSIEHVQISLQHFKKCEERAQQQWNEKVTKSL